MNNLTGLNQLDMLAMTGLLAQPQTRRNIRDSGARSRMNAKKVTRSERRKKNKTARRSRARNRS